MKEIRTAMLTLIIASTLCMAFNVTPVLIAEATEDYPFIDSGYFVNAVGTYFEITNSTYLNITLTSSETVNVILESISGIVSLFIESNSSATLTNLTFSGFEPNTTYYRYQEGYLIENFTTDSSGGYTYTQDISEPHHVFIEEEESTLHISEDYTFTHDIYQRINVCADNIVIDGNGYALEGPGGYGFYLARKSGVTIKNVAIKRWSFGIVLWQSSGNTISGNTVSSNTFGIGLEMYSSGNMVGGNTVSNNGWGITVRYNDNTISGNTVSNNGWGIYQWLSSDNTISGNTVSNNNRYGIHLWYCSGELIYHNNVIDNRVQAYDTTPAYNDWHHPDLLEGNYWSDYPGVDDGSGTGKHAIAGDGIGDTDIPWPNPNYDYYPFMHESGWMVITATIDIDPDTLNLKSNGEFVTAYIELPEGYNAADIVLETVYLDGVQAITDPQYGFVTDPDSYLMDHDGDGILERMVKFDRAKVRDTLTDVIDYEEGTKFYDITATVTGKLADGTPFEGTDTIVVIKK